MKTYTVTYWLALLVITSGLSGDNDDKHRHRNC